MNRLLVASTLYFSVFPLLLTAAERLPEYTVQRRARLQSHEFPATGTGCELKRFQLVEYLRDLINPVQVRGKRITTQMLTSYETTSKECLRDFGIVQYIRGCSFYSTLAQPSNPSGPPRIQYRIANARMIGGKIGRIHHPEWAIDSDDPDPLYNSQVSSDPIARHGIYRFSSSPLRLVDSPSILEEAYKTFFKQKAKHLGTGEPPFPILFARDMPVASQIQIYDDEISQEQETRSASLFFKTCIYRVSDIPLTGSPELPEVPPEKGGPLHCFEWNHSHIFNHDSQDFEETDTPHAFCLKQAQ